MVGLVACLALVASTGVAFAVFPNDSVTHFTGCLNTSASPGGTFVDVAAGETPSKACGKGQVLAHLSGGDITNVQTASGSGLTGGTDNGAASLALDSSGCTTGGVLKWDGSSWACGSDNNATYSGNDFALSDQTCSGSDTFVFGISSDGGLACDHVSLRETTVQTTGTVLGDSCAPWGHVGGAEFCSSAPALDLFASCPSTYPVAVSGGYQTGTGPSTSDALFVYDNNPTFGGAIGQPADGWHARFVLYSNQSSTVDVYAVCARVP